MLLCWFDCFLYCRNNLAFRNTTINKLLIVSYTVERCVCVCLCVCVRAFLCCVRVCAFIMTSWYGNDFRFNRLCLLIFCQRNSFVSGRFPLHGTRLCFYQTRSAWSVDQGSNKNHSPAYNFAPTVTKFCVMWEGLSLPHDTKFGNCRCRIVDSRAFPTWSLIHGLRWSGLIKAEPVVWSYGVLLLLFRTSC